MGLSQSLLGQTKMIEYSIKRTDGTWFDLSAGSDPYRPTTIPFKREQG
jgi:hypothetical protein